MSYKAIFSLAAIYTWELEHMDVKMAFFYGKINKEIYVKQPVRLSASGVYSGRMITGIAVARRGL